MNGLNELSTKTLHDTKAFCGTVVVPRMLCKLGANL